MQGSLIARAETDVNIDRTDNRKRTNRRDDRKRTNRTDDRKWTNSTHGYAYSFHKQHSVKGYIQSNTLYQINH